MQLVSSSVFMKFMCNNYVQKDYTNNKNSDFFKSASLKWAPCKENKFLNKGPGHLFEHLW